MEALRLLAKVPPIMRSTYWRYLIDAFDLELQSVLAAASNKKAFYDVQSLSYDQLIDLSTQLRIYISPTVFSPDQDNATVSSDDPTRLSFIRREMLATSFKLAYKSTPILYKSLYRALSRKGQLFIYGLTGSGYIIRLGLSVFPSLLTADPMQPFFFNSDDNYNGSVTSFYKLDAGNTLDAGWKLDQSSTYQTTNHFALELMLDRTVTKTTPSGTSTVLLSDGFFRFLYQNISYLKRVREVPHVGAQLGLLLDSSGYIDSPAHARAYTVPSILASAICAQPAVLPTLTLDRVVKMQFGTGAVANLRSRLMGLGVLPTALAAKINSVPVLFEEKSLSSSWIAAAAAYAGSTVGDLLMHDGAGAYLGGAGACNGSNHAFTGTLPRAPISPRSLTILVTHQATQYKLVDDGAGRLVGDVASGTINYATGAYSFDTSFNITRQTTLVTSTAGMTTFTRSLPLDVGATIAGRSVQVSYVIGGRTYIAVDNGAGGFDLSGGLSPHLLSGSVNYTTGSVTMTFDIALDYDAPKGAGVNVMATYTFPRIYTPDAASQIFADSYIISQPVSITEAGLVLDDGSLIAYTTFPPVELFDVNYHLSVHLYMYQGTFA